MAHNLWACFCAQTLIARDRVVTFERRLELTKTYGQRNFLAYRRCHCYTTEKVMGIPSQNCDAVCVHKLRSRINKCNLSCLGSFCSSQDVWRVGLIYESSQQKLG